MEVSVDPALEVRVHLGDGAVRVYRDEAVPLLHHLELLRHHPLIDDERVVEVVGEPEVGPRLVVVERRVLLEDPVEELLGLDVEIEDQVRLDREAEEVVGPPPARCPSPCSGPSACRCTGRRGRCSPPRAPGLSCARAGPRSPRRRRGSASSSRAGSFCFASSMPLPISSDLFSPVVATAWPSDSSLAVMRSTWVDLPGPVRSLYHDQAALDLAALEVGDPVSVELERPRRPSDLLRRSLRTQLPRRRRPTTSGGSSSMTCFLISLCCSSMSSVPSMTRKPSVAAIDLYSSIIRLWKIL